MGYSVVSSADFLAQIYQGSLCVIVHTLSGFTEKCIKDFCPEITGGDSTLFDYVGNACASLFTNMTTRLSVKTCPEDWEVVRFEPKEGILEVRQIGGGSDLTPEPDDWEKFVAIDQSIHG